MKKTLIRILAMTTTLMMLSTAAFAQDNGQAGGGPGGNQNGGGMQQEGNEPPNGEQGDNQGGMGGGMQGGKMGLNTDDITTAISALEDSDTASSLTTLLEAYETAAAGDDVDATIEAMQALQEALESAGIEVQSEGGMNGKMNGEMDRGMNYGRFLDVDQVEAAISELSDDDTATTLTTLLTAYQEAVDSDDADATQTALQSLLDAMSTAQLQVESVEGHSNIQRMDAMQGAYLDTDAVAEAIATLSDSDTISSLTTLLNAYLEADETDPQAQSDAFAELMTAIQEANLQI